MVKRGREEEGAEHQIVDEEAWKAARLEVLKKEKEITKLQDEMAKMRQALPWMKLSKQYTLQGASGAADLKALFGEHDTLMVYHFMFEPEWERPCKSCSMWMDAVNGMLPFINRKTAFVAVAAAPITKIMAQAEIKNWRVPFFSAEGSEFSRDMQVQFTKEEVEDKDFKGYNFGRKPFCAESPGVTVFKLVDGDVVKTYSCFARGLEPLNNVWGILDMLPEGRNEKWPMDWVQHKEDYTNAVDKSDEEEIRKQMTNFNEALQNRDINAIVADVGDGVTLYDLLGPDYKVVSKKDYQGAYEACLPYLPEKMQCEHKDLKVSVSGNVAFAYGMHKISEAGASEPGEGDSWNRITVCYEKIDGKWKSVHEHISLPYDMETDKILKFPTLASSSASVSG